MSRFVEQSTFDIDLGGGDWVKAYKRLSFGDRRRLEEILLGNRTKTDDPAALHHHDSNIEMLRLSIVAWGGPGFCKLAAHPHDGDCLPRPITTDTIDRLDETGERIQAELRKSQVTHSAFLAGTPSSSTAKGSPADSAASPSTTPARSPFPPESGSGGTSAISASGSISSTSASDTAGPGIS